MKEEFNKGLRWRVGDGSTIKFWEDRWLLDEPLYIVVFDQTLISTSDKVDTFISDKKWNEQRLNQLECILQANIINKIKEYNLPTNDIRDRIYL